MKKDAAGIATFPSLTSPMQSLVKQIVKQLNLDDKKFEPRSVRYAISNAKIRAFHPKSLKRNNQIIVGGWLPKFTITTKMPGSKQRPRFWWPDSRSSSAISANEQVLGYWYQKFHHILVDEYQDTNRTQYDLIRLLVTNGRKKERVGLAQSFSFVVGDADQSIYSFRLDFTILLDFQQDFGDGLPDEDTRTMVKEKTTAQGNILKRLTSWLKTTRNALKSSSPHAESVSRFIVKADDEIAEAEFVVHQLRTLDQHPEINWGSLPSYRTNQSRPFEELVLASPQHCWGLNSTIAKRLKMR